MDRPASETPEHSAIGPDFSFEHHYLESGFQHIAGVDEAGRGPLAGPVVAAAVILDAANIPQGINDSKKLTAAKRDSILHALLRSAVVAWACVPPKEIDAINIREAALLAMRRALDCLAVRPDFALIDGRDLPAYLPCDAAPIIKGDARSLSIAAASIVAKEVRDHAMKQLHTTYPFYGFDRNKGYGSQLHREALKENGPCPAHRKTFSPIKHMIAEER